MTSEEKAKSLGAQLYLYQSCTQAVFTEELDAAEFKTWCEENDYHSWLLTNKCIGYYKRPIYSHRLEHPTAKLPPIKTMRNH